MTSRDMVNIGVDFLRPSWIEEELDRGSKPRYYERSST